MAIEETVSAEDMMAVTPKSKGKMDFPRSAASVAKKIMGQQQFKGLPKQWKGGGDYFFETQDDGTIKVTGGDKANSLTGGKSTIIKDRERIRKIVEAARGGDILEEDVSYTAEAKEDAAFRGGGSPGLEYLNETDADAVSAAERDPEATQLDSGMKRLQAVRTHRDILEKELPQVDREIVDNIIESNPDIKFLSETVDRLSAGVAEDPSMNASVLALADLLVKKIKAKGGM